MPERRLLKTWEPPEAVNNEVWAEKRTLPNRQVKESPAMTSSVE